MPHCNDAYRRTRPARSRLSASRGFTLLELLLVVTVLSAVAWMTLGTVSNNSDQIRFEDTRNRLAAIRRAIIGDTSRTVNGGPEIRGYVADMGGLPENINALISKDYCQAPEDTNKETEVTLEKTCATLLQESACTTAGCQWVTQPSYTPSSSGTYGLGYGWNGPYLTAAEYSVFPRFQDGWGNQVGAGLHTDTNKRDSDRNSFGWVFRQVFDSNTKEIHLAVRSLGKNGIVDSSAVTPFDADYPPQYTQEQLNPSAPPEWIVSTTPQASQWLVSDRDYRIKITDSGNAGATGDATGGLRIDFGTPASCWVSPSCSKPSYLTKSDRESNSATWKASGSCSNSTSDNGTDCVSEGEIWSWGFCSNPSYLTKSDCEGNSATWVLGTCSNTSFFNEKDCVNNGSTWTWQVKPRPKEAETSTDCATQKGYWQPINDLCMAMYVIKAGNLSTQPVVSLNKQIQWDGAQKLEEFVFEDTTSSTLDEDMYLYQGQVAWGIFEYDSTATPKCQITKPFPAGSATWKNFIYVPGTTLQPFERKINP